MSAHSSPSIKENETDLTASNPPYLLDMARNSTGTSRMDDILPVNKKGRHGNCAGVIGNVGSPPHIAMPHRPSGAAGQNIFEQSVHAVRRALSAKSG